MERCTEWAHRRATTHARLFMYQDKSNSGERAASFRLLYVQDDETLKCVQAAGRASGSLYPVTPSSCEGYHGVVLALLCEPCQCGSLLPLSTLPNPGVGVGERLCLLLQTGGLRGDQMVRKGK